MYAVIFARKVLDFCAKLIFFNGVVKKQAFCIYRFTLKVFQERNRQMRCTEDWQLERDVLFFVDLAVNALSASICGLWRSYMENK